MLKKISDISTSISNMAAGKWTSNQKQLDNPMLRGYLVSKAHKNNISTAMPMYLGIFTLPDVAVTLEINMAYKKRYSSLSLTNVVHITAM